MSKQIVAIFGNKDQAEQSAHTLEQTGIQKDTISIAYLTNNQQDENQTTNRQGENETTSVTNNDNISNGTATGSAIGGVAGLVLGAGTIAVPGLGILAAAGPLAGLITGAVTGGVVGGITDLGFSDNDSGTYDKEIRRGRVYFSVPINENNGGKISKILRENGAVNIEIHNHK